MEPTGKRRHIIAKRHAKALGSGPYKDIRAPAGGSPDSTEESAGE